MVLTEKEKKTDIAFYQLEKNVNDKIVILFQKATHVNFFKNKSSHTYVMNLEIYGEKMKERNYLKFYQPERINLNILVYFLPVFLLGNKLIILAMQYTAQDMS